MTETCVITVRSVVRLSLMFLLRAISGEAATAIELKDTSIEIQLIDPLDDSTRS